MHTSSPIVAVGRHRQSLVLLHSHPSPCPLGRPSRRWLKQRVADGPLRHVAATGTDNPNRLVRVLGPAQLTLSDLRV